MANGVDVVVVSYNTRDMTVRCVRALLASIRVECQIVVVDNGSTDGSPEALECLSDSVQVIRMGRNSGFGSANNVGMACGTADYVAFINSDAFVEPETLHALVSYQAMHPGVGVVGPLILNTDGSEQKSRFAFPTPMRAWLDNLGLTALFTKIASYKSGIGAGLEQGPCAVDWVSGAGFMVCRAAINAVGGFDEKFFMYSEETDWQFRIRKGGWQIAWVPSARLVHAGGGSGGGGESARAREWFYQGVDRYFRKHHGQIGLLQIRAATAIGAVGRICFAVFWRPKGGALERLGWLLHRQLTKTISMDLGVGRGR